MPPFTPHDNLCEILLKVMLGDAWRNDSMNEEARQVARDWMATLGMEGPERRRVEALMENRVDDFQAELFESQLKATLAYAENRDRLHKILANLLNNRRTVYQVESDLEKKIKVLLSERSGIELLLHRNDSTGDGG